MTAIRINRVYTRSGDKGETSLVGGERVSKSDTRVEAYGEIDELNSSLSLVNEFLQVDEHAAKLQSLRALVSIIQQELFDIGAELAALPGTVPQLPRTSAEQVDRLEKYCDALNEGLPELQSFIVPGGSLAIAQTHIARTICRRAERRVIALQSVTGSENPELIRYLNRLSDLLFIMTRWLLAQCGIEPQLWVQVAVRDFPDPESFKKS